MSKFILISTLILSAFVTQAQRNLLLPATIENGDTIAIYQLPEFEVNAKMSAKMRKWYKKNDKLIRNLKIVMPYAKLTSQRLRAIDRTLLGIEDENLRKQFYKEQEAKLIEEFEDDIRRMTFSQGILLIKLIDRETGKSSYKIIQDYRSNITAVFWQSLARLFSYNLKEKYDPAKEQEIEMAIKLLGYE